MFSPLACFSPHNFAGDFIDFGDDVSLDESFSPATPTTRSVPKIPSLSSLPVFTRPITSPAAACVAAFPVCCSPTSDGGSRNDSLRRHVRHIERRANDVSCNGRRDNASHELSFWASECAQAGRNDERPHRELPPVSVSVPLVVVPSPTSNDVARRYFSSGTESRPAPMGNATRNNSKRKSNGAGSGGGDGADEKTQAVAASSERPAAARANSKGTKTTEVVVVQTDASAKSRLRARPSLVIPDPAGESLHCNEAFDSNNVALANSELHGNHVSPPHCNRANKPLPSHSRARSRPRTAPMGIARWFWDAAAGVAGTGGGAGEAEGAGGAAAESRTGKPSEDATVVTATGRRAAPPLAIDIRGGGSSSALSDDGDKAVPARTTLYPSARSEGGGGERRARDVLIVKGGRPPADSGRARGGVFRKKQRRGKGKRSVFVYELVRAPAAEGGGDQGGRGLPRARTAGAAESGSSGMWVAEGLAEGSTEGARGKAQGWQQRSLDRSDTQSDIADVDEWRREMEKYLAEKERRASLEATQKERRASLDSCPKDSQKERRQLTREEKRNGGLIGEQHERENDCSGGDGSWGLRDDDDDSLGASGRACNAYGGCDEGNNSWHDTSSEGEAGIDRWDLDADIEEHHSEDESSAVLSAATSGGGEDAWSVGGSSGSEERRERWQAREEELAEVGADGEELGAVGTDEDWLEEAEEGVLLVDEGRVVLAASGSDSGIGHQGRDRGCSYASASAPARAAVPYTALPHAVHQASSRADVARAAEETFDAQAGRRGEDSESGSDSGSSRECGRPVLLRCEGVRGSNRVRAFDPTEYPVPAAAAPGAACAVAFEAVHESRETEEGERERQGHDAVVTSAAAGKAQHVASWWQFGGADKAASSGQGGRWKSTGSRESSAVNRQGRSRPVGPPPTPQSPDDDTRTARRTLHSISPPALPLRASSSRLPPSPGLRRQQSAAASLAAVEASQLERGRHADTGAREVRGRAAVVFHKSSSTGSSGAGGGVSGTQPKRIAHSITYHPGGNTMTSLATAGSSSSSSSSSSNKNNNNSSNSSHSRASPSSSTSRPSPPLPLSPPPASLVPLPSPPSLVPRPLLSLSFSASASALAKPRPLSGANSAAPTLLHPQPILLAGGKRFSTRCPAAAAAAVAANGGAVGAAATATADGAAGGAGLEGAAKAAGIGGRKSAGGLKASAVVYHPPFSNYRHYTDVAAQKEEASLRELEQQLERERRRREEEEEVEMLAVAGERGVREVRVREGEWEEGGAWMVKMPGRGVSRRLEELCEKAVGMGAGGVGMGLDGVEMCLELERGVVSIGPSVGGRGGMGRSLSMGVGLSPEAMQDARGREQMREHAVTSPAPVPPPMRRSRTDTRQERRAREQREEQEQMGGCVKQDVGVEAVVTPPMRRSRTDTRQERRAREQRDEREERELMGTCVKHDAGLAPVPPPMRRSRTESRQERGMRARHQAVAPAVRVGGSRREGSSAGEAGSGRVLRRGKTQPSRSMEQREGVARRREGDLLIRTHTL
ncbi:unnamed protein product [Closterium sp. NIES-54]